MTITINVCTTQTKVHTNPQAYLDAHTPKPQLILGRPLMLKYGLKNQRGNSLLSEYTLSMNECIGYQLNFKNCLTVELRNATVENWLTEKRAYIGEIFVPNTMPFMSYRRQAMQERQGFNYAEWANVLQRHALEMALDYETGRTRK